MSISNLKIYAKGFDNHRMVSFINDPKTNLQGFIAIHRGNGDNIPAFGATRYTSYPSMEAALEDSLRLSKFMSYKAALAGLRYGGAKGVIIAPKGNSVTKKQLLRSYAYKVNMLGGRFITGADVGINQAEVKYMSLTSPHIVGVQIDPVYYTGIGIMAALQVSLKHYFGSQEVKNRTFAIQGVGKIGTTLLEHIYKEARQIIIADPNVRRLKLIKKIYPKIHIVQPQQIYQQQVDVFSPCALGNTLTPKTIANLRCKMILGGANDQLDTKASGEIIHRLGILYAPDYVVNAGGLISVVDEFEHKASNADRTGKRVLNIATTLNKIFTESKKSNKPTNIIAEQMAEKIFNRD
jgi:leucine dehydrogenase